jgi:hypothetical protein
VRRQILRRDCETGQWPAAGSAVSMQLFCGFKAGAALGGDLNLPPRSISAEMSHALLFALQLLPKARGSRYPSTSRSARIVVTLLHTHTRAPDLPRPGLLSLPSRDAAAFGQRPDSQVRLSAAPARDPAMVDVDQMRRAGKMPRSRVEHQKQGAHPQQRRQNRCAKSRSPLRWRWPSQDLRC